MLPVLGIIGTRAPTVRVSGLRVRADAGTRSPVGKRAGNARAGTRLQSLKQSIARRFALRAAEPLWQERYYDFNLWSERKFVEKLRYIHRNPVTRGLVARPEDWPWSSFRHYATGEICPVEIESQWTARARERLGIFLTVRFAGTKKTPAQAELGRGTLEIR